MSQIVVFDTRPPPHVFLDKFPKYNLADSVNNLVTKKQDKNSILKIFSG